MEQVSAVTLRIASSAAADAALSLDPIHSEETKSVPIMLQIIFYNVQWFFFVIIVEEKLKMHKTGELNKKRWKIL